MKQKSDIHIYKSIPQLMRELGMPAPSHPLITLVDYDRVTAGKLQKGTKISLDFYKISFKKKFNGQVKYGQGHYDFDDGGLAFLSPKQIVISPDNDDSYEGFALYFHPDFIRSYSLGNSIAQYGFFSYSVTEALFLSSKEKKIVTQLFRSVYSELETNIDTFSQDVLVSQIELLLNYSNRFYSRQFITRKNINNSILVLLDNLLNDYFDENKVLENGPPSIPYISEQLQLSQRYLSDMLRSLTGLTTQQYVQNRLIEHSKNLLSLTSLSVSEIAFRLGFEHPQSFSKLFKSKTSFSPLEFRSSFN